MNNIIQEFAKNFLKEELKKLPINQQLLFKRMYSHKNLNANVDDVVDNIPEEKLDWAMQQVQNSIDKQK